MVRLAFSSHLSDSYFTFIISACNHLCMFFCNIKRSYEIPWKLAPGCQQKCISLIPPRRLRDWREESREKRSWAGEDLMETSDCLGNTVWDECFQLGASV